MSSDDEGSSPERDDQTGGEEDPEKIEDLRNPKVVTKYREAGDIANAALKQVIQKCKAGTKIVDICTAGDAYITEATGKIYKTGKVEKGTAFPTCVSVNHIVGHYSPLPNESTELKDGDVVKIDLGVHIDGYAAVVAHTLVVGGAAATGRQADVLAAAYTAADAAVRKLKPGVKNTEVAEVLSKVAAEFKCQLIQGVISHSMERFVIDGKKIILNRPDHDQKAEDCEIVPNDVWTLDVVMSTGEGKSRESEVRTTVYKRQQEANYQLKMKASRACLSEIQKKSPAFPFTLRDLDEKTARMGIVECYQHGLVTAYPVLIEREGETVAHVKLTALVLPSGGTLQITGVPAERPKFTSEHSVKDDDLKKLLQTSLAAAGAKKNKKKKAKKPEGEKKAAPAAAAPAKAEAKASGKKESKGKAEAAPKKEAKKEEAKKAEPKPAAKKSAKKA